MLAHSPAMAESAKAEALLPAYRSALQHLFGEDWKEGHERVKKWAERLNPRQAAAPKDAAETKES